MHPIRVVPVEGTYVLAQRLMDGTLDTTGIPTTEEGHVAWLMRVVENEETKK
jgi:hypothetical protein